MPTSENQPAESADPFLRAEISSSIHDPVRFGPASPGTFSYQLHFGLDPADLASRNEQRSQSINITASKFDTKVRFWTTPRPGPFQFWALALSSLTFVAMLRQIKFFDSVTLRSAENRAFTVSVLYLIKP